MVWNEHADAIEYTIAVNVSSEDDDEECGYFYRNELSYEDWCDWHSEHLMNMWMSTREYNELNYNPMQLNINFSNFCEYIYRFSAKRP